MFSYSTVLYDAVVSTGYLWQLPFVTFHYAQYKETATRVHSASPYDNMPEPRHLRMGGTVCVTPHNRNIKTNIISNKCPKVCVRAYSCLSPADCLHTLQQTM